MRASKVIQTSLFFRILSWFLITFLIPFQIILQKQLRQISKHMMEKIEDSRTESGIEFFKLFTHLGNGSFLVVVAPIIHNTLHPKTSSTIIIFSAIVHYLGNFLALILQEPRPFWYSSSIKGEICQKGYGNPCLTVLIMGTLLPILFIETFHTTKFRYFIYPSVIIFIILSSFNGIYLGESFPHQVLITLCLNLALVTVYFSLARQISHICFVSCYGYKDNRKYIIYWILFVFGAFTIVTVVYLIIHTQPSDYPQLVSNSLKHCEDEYEISGTHNFRLSLEVFYALGYVVGNMSTSKKMTLYWMITSWWKRLLRACISVGVNIALYYAFQAIPASDLFAKCIVHSILPYMMMSISFTGVLPVVLGKCGLVNFLKPDVDSEIILAKLEDAAII